MAYVAGDALVIVRGSFGFAEEWSNTWAFRSAGGPATPQEIVDEVHDFYEGVAVTGPAPMWNALVTADEVRYKDLFTGQEEPVSFSQVSGTGVGAYLPAECAIRISLRSLTRNGGPFLPPIQASGLGDDGQLLDTYQAAIVGELQDLVDNLDTAGSHLGLHSPTTNTVYALAGCKVGRTFDAMRSRRRSMPEVYENVTLP